jgi:hypothetical protein
VLGGGRLFFPQASMLAPEAIIQILGLYDWGMGTTIAVILVVPSLIIYVFGEYYLKKRSYVTVTGTPTAFTLRTVPPAVKWTLFASACWSRCSSSAWCWSWSPGPSRAPGA